MPDKLGNGIGIPFSVLLGSGGGSSPSLSDGYYYQLEVAEPRTASGWTSGPDLHNGSAGDVSFGYATGGGAGTHSIALMIAKGAGMTLNGLDLSPGFTFALSLGSCYGSNDLTNWTEFVFNGLHFQPPGSGSFQWFSGGLSLSSSSLIGPYQYVCWTLADSGQVGCADVRLRNGASEVGP